MHCFLTGATGFLGGALLRQLLAAGHRVTALVRDPSAARPLAEAGASLASGDLTDPESLRAGMWGADAVFHLAAWYKIGVRDRGAAWRVNVEGTRNVLETMRALGIPRGVYTSTLAVFSDTGGKLVDETYRPSGGRWLSEYDRTKAAAHFDVALPMMEQGLPLVIAQPGLTYGPGDTSMVREVLIQYLNRRLYVAPRNTAYCWAHVEDVARAHLLALERGRAGESYIVAGPAHTLIEALEIARRITGIPAPRLRPGPRAMRVLAAAMGIVDRVLLVPPSLTAEGLRVTAGVTYLGNHGKARRELGFDPRPLEEGLRETLRHEMRLLSRSRG